MKQLTQSAFSCRGGSLKVSGMSVSVGHAQAGRGAFPPGTLSLTTRLACFVSDMVTSTGFLIYSTGGWLLLKTAVSMERLYSMYVQ